MHEHPTVWRALIRCQLSFGPLELLIEPQAASTCDRIADSKCNQQPADAQCLARAYDSVHLEMPNVHCCYRWGTFYSFQKRPGGPGSGRLRSGTEPFICGHSPGACRGLYPYRGHACHHGAASGPLAGGHAAGPYACNANVDCLQTGSICRSYCRLHKHPEAAMACNSTLPQTAARQKGSLNSHHWQGEAAMTWHA